MKKIPRFVWLLITLAVLYAGTKIAWGIAYPSGTWRYKMMVAVDTPEGEKTGSAVREISVTCTPRVLPDVIPCIPRVKGEAVVIDLGKRGVLFALMTGAGGDVDYGDDIVYKAFSSPMPALTPEGIRYYRSLKGVTATLTPEEYPMFVRFRDPKDPKTLEQLLDMEQVGTGTNRKMQIKEDHFEDAFGKGVHLKSVTMEMTDESVARGVVAKYRPTYGSQFMKWLSSLPYGDPHHFLP